jgi:hypothetical protein
MQALADDAKNKKLGTTQLWRCPAAQQLDVAAPRSTGVALPKRSALTGYDPKELGAAKMKKPGCDRFSNCRTLAIPTSPSQPPSSCDAWASLRRYVVVRRLQPRPTLPCLVSVSALLRARDHLIPCLDRRPQRCGVYGPRRYGLLAWLPQQSRLTLTTTRSRASRYFTIPRVRSVSSY